MSRTRHEQAFHSIEVTGYVAAHIACGRHGDFDVNPLGLDGHTDQTVDRYKEPQATP